MTYDGIDIGDWEEDNRDRLLRGYVLDNWFGFVQWVNENKHTALQELYIEEKAKEKDYHRYCREVWETDGERAIEQER